MIKSIKKVFVSFLLLIVDYSLFTFVSQAQTSAPPGIFADTVYHVIKTTSDVVYGSNYNIYYNEEDTLKLDIYEPDSIIDYIRPLIIFVHGGGFTGGDKTIDKAKPFAKNFAKRGYLYASINYRLCIDDPTDTVDNFQCVYMCTQDAMSAVRFFRKHAYEYCVDTSKIFMIGTSAGAAICLNVAYWDQDEANQIFDTSPFGELDNSSGNEGYSSYTHSIVSCWGGIPDTAWLQGETTTNQLFHGTADSTVPYTWGLGQNGVYLFGSKTIHEASLANNIESYLHPFVGEGHGVTTGSPQFDTLLEITNAYFYNHLNYNEGYVPCGIGTTVPEIPTSGSRNAITVSSLNDRVLVISNNQSQTLNGVLKIFSMDGRELINSKLVVETGSNFQFNCSSLSPGCYLVKIEGLKETIVQKVVVGN